MTDYVIDTNVWVMVDNIEEVNSLEEIKCVEICERWLRDFMNSDNRLVVDHLYAIFGEYRGQITLSRRLANKWLNALERAPRDRIVDIAIEFDDDGNAVLPFDLHDKSDRKFAAVALAHKPTPPIVDATDTDWEKDKEKLEKAGLIIQEMCPAYIEANM